MRVWNATYGFGTVISERNGARFVRFDLLPYDPMWVEVRVLIPASWMKEQ